MNIPEDKIVKELSEELMILLERKENISITSIILHTIDLMQFIEQYSQLKGCQKKNIIISVIKKINANTHVMEFVNDDLPFLIDILVSIDKRKLHIKAKKCIGYFKLCT